MAASKYQEVSLTLEKYIRVKCPCGRLPGMLQLSKEFGVHHATLKKAIQLLEDRGLLTIDGTRGTFVSNHSARQGEVLPTIGIIGLEVFRSISYLNDKYRSIGCRLLALGIPDGLAIGNEVDFLLKLPLSAAIVLGSSARKELMHLLLQRSFPVVGNVQDGLPWMNGVEFDHYESYKLVLQHLHAAGHRRIAFIETARSEEFQFFLDNIQRAYRDVLGNDFAPELFRIKDDLQEQYQRWGEDYQKNIFAERMNFFLALRKPPTALIASANFVRAGMEFLRQHGIRIPQDLSVVPVGSPQTRDSFFSNLVANQDDLVEWAVPRLLAILSGTAMPVQKKLIPMQYIPGHSIMIRT
ncbi:MAG: substrate-binding domain-containing protein [Lentisphaeria bacterium]